MQGTETNSLFFELEKITQANLAFVEEKVLVLSQEQLSWSQNSESWNIIHVLAHLNAYAKHYQKIMIDKIQNTRHNQPSEFYNSSPLGKGAWKSVKLGNLKNIKRRLRSPRNYNPVYNKTLLNGSEIEEFIAFQMELFELLKSAKSVNLRKVRIPLIMSKFVKLRLGDAMMFHIYHNERHVEQINKIIQNPRFPK